MLKWKIRSKIDIGNTIEYIWCEIIPSHNEYIQMCKVTHTRIEVYQFTKRDFGMDNEYVTKLENWNMKRTIPDLVPIIAFSLPHQSHHNLGFINFPYNWLCPVPDIFPLPLVRPQDLPKMFWLPQQGIDIPLHPHRCIFLIPPDILVVPICAQFAALGLVDGGGNIGPKFGPCLLQLATCPLPKSLLITLSNLLHILPCTLWHNPPPPISILLLKTLPLLASSSLGDLSELFSMTILLSPEPPLFLLILQKLTYHQG